MELTARLVVLMEPEALKQLKVYAAQNGVSMGEMARAALEDVYGEALRREQHVVAPSVSTKVRKSTRGR
jgi:hypothetical protein